MSIFNSLLLQFQKQMRPLSFADGLVQSITIKHYLLQGSMSINNVN